MARFFIVTINYAPEPSGFAPHATALAEHLARQGHDVSVFTGFPFAPEWRRRREDRGRVWSTERSGNVGVHRVTHFIPRRPSSVVQRIAMEASFGVTGFAAMLGVVLRTGRPDAVLYIGAQPALAMLARVFAALVARPYFVRITDLAARAALDVGILGGRLSRLLETFGYTSDGGCGGPLNIDRIDLKTNSVLGSIPISKSVIGLAVSPDGKVALGSGGDTILVIDLTTNTEVAPVACVGVCPYSFLVGATFNADGSRAYFIDDGTNELITLDTTVPLAPVELSKTPIVTPGGAWELAIFGNLLWVVNAGGPSDVVIFDVSSDPPVQLPPLGLAIFGFELDVQIAPSQCKKGGWMTFGFKNQGECVSAIKSKRP